MGGGLLQLVAYGAQDVYLTGNPQITFFKTIYRRYTNFSAESIEQTFNGNPDFGGKVTCILSKSGDLVNYISLHATLPKFNNIIDKTAWISHVGHHLIKSISIDIGGQEIDKHYGEWLQIWYELTITEGHKDGYNEIIGNTSELTTLSIRDGIGNNPIDKEVNISIPLQFWFCKSPGLSIPIIALQYHEIKINVEFRKLEELHVYDNISNNILLDSPNLTGCSPQDLNIDELSIVTGSLSNVSLYVDYIYLETEERRKFAQINHEYLIEQLQLYEPDSIEAGTTKISPELIFNHPIKEFIWIIQLDSNLENGFNQYSNYTNTKEEFCYGKQNPHNGKNTITDAALVLNGHERFSSRAGDYFNMVQPYQHHSRIPSSSGINVYSFALHPEDHQPSGTCNMSRIDNIVFELGLNITTSAKIRIYALSYNVLRIMSGMAGVAYTN